MPDRPGGGDEMKLAPHGDEVAVAYEALDSVGLCNHLATFSMPAEGLGGEGEGGSSRCEVCVGVGDAGRATSWGFTVNVVFPIESSVGVSISAIILNTGVLGCTNVPRRGDCWVPITILLSVAASADARSLADKLSLRSGSCLCGPAAVSCC